MMNKCVSRAAKYLITVVLCCLTARRAHSFTLKRAGRPSVYSLYVSKELPDSETPVSMKQETLSRPERKKLERQLNKNKRSRYTRQIKLPLHSRAISELNEHSTADDVMRAIKRAQNTHDAHDLRAIDKFLMDHTGRSFGFGYKGSMLARLAVAAMHMNEKDVAYRAIEARRVEYRAGMLPMESSAIVRGLLRLNNVTFALEVLDDELSLPLSGTQLTDPGNRERLKHRALSLASVASRHFFEDEPTMAVRACSRLAELGPMMRESKLEASDINLPWARLLKGASQCESRRREGLVMEHYEIDVKMPCNLVYAVLRAMATFPSDNSDNAYEVLCNALVRRTLFVTGAVNMDGLPPADRGEVMFIGRSNVGKSSLVNMVTNRKSLAFTSKTPGKTQQFNYFAVNDKPGREKEIKYGDIVEGEKDPDSFYIVDAPGFGYAKVPHAKRKAWLDFTRDYVSTRKTLRVIFHLVDSRHGPTDEDSSIMRQMSDSLPKHVSYVIVLTKADKNVKGTSAQNQGKVSISVLDGLRQTMKENRVGSVPVILTSSETKLGRDDMWRYMRLAAEA